jgi:MFS family permease
LPNEPEPSKFILSPSPQGHLMTDAPDSLKTQAFVEKNFRWNFTVNALDISFFVLAMNMVSQSTILPLLVVQLTDSKIAVGLIPAVFSIGFLLPQLFTAGYAESLRRKKPFIVLWSVIGERTPYLLIAIAIWLFAKDAPLLTLGLIYLSLLIANGTAGALNPAWYDMIAKVIPLKRRGLWMGVGSGAGALMGIAGAALAGWFLTHYEYPLQYVMCFLVAAFFQYLSWACLALNREPESDTVKVHYGLRRYFKNLPNVLRRDRNYLVFLISRSVMNLGAMASGFYIVYGSERFGLSGAQVGGLTAVLVGTQALMNLSLGMIGDRYGHKVVLTAGALAIALAALTALVLESPAALWVIFILLGTATAADSVAGFSIIVEFGSPEDRPTYIGLTNTLLAPVRALAPILGGWLAATLGFSWLFSAALVASLSAVVLLRWWLKEPRQLLESKPALP